MNERTMRYIRFLCLPLLGILAACGQADIPQGVKVGKPYVIDGKTYYPKYDEDYDRTGTASWYGPGFHGKYTANGEVFDQDALTAAHPTLPMPSIVRVTNIENGKSLIIRINDRGPFKDNRIIDLSRGSARALDIHSLAKVRVQYLKNESIAFVESVKQGSPIDVAELNRREKVGEPTVIVADSTSVVDPQPVINAPIESVTTSEVAGSNVVSKDLSPPSAPKGKKPLLVSEAWADDNRTLPTPPAEKVKGKPVELFHDEELASTADPPAATPQAKPATAPPLKKPAVSSGPMIMAGAFSTQANAEKLRSKLQSVAAVQIDPVNVNGKSLWRVRVGPFASRTEAETALQKVRSLGVPDAKIAR